MDQPSRFATLNNFKAGNLQLLVCSDVAARGLDIGGLSHVFNFDVPFHAEDYVHRIGRTGRAGREGHAYTIATADDAHEHSQDGGRGGSGERLEAVVDVKSESVDPCALGVVVCAVVGGAAHAEEGAGVSAHVK